MVKQGMSSDAFGQMKFILVQNDVDVDAAPVLILKRLTALKFSLLLMQV